MDFDKTACWQKGCKCVFKAKQDERGEIQRYKTKLVVKGCSQKCREGSNETFTPVVKHTTIRDLLTLVACKSK